MWFRSLSLPAFVVAMAFSNVGAKIVQKMREGTYWEGVWPFLEPWDVEGLRTTSGVWNVLGKYGPYGELFFFLRRSPLLLQSVEFFKPCVLAETLRACALIGLHLMTVEGASGSSGCQSPDFGDMWRYGGPKSREHNGRIGNLRGRF